MKTTWIMKLIQILMSLMILLVGCSSNGELVFETTPKVTDRYMPTVYLTRTSTVQLLPTILSTKQTPFLSETKPPTLTPSLPPKPTATITPTPIATLTSDESYRYVVDLLKTNNNCQLSCLWGFVPEKTPIETVQLFFAHIGRSLGSSKRGFGAEYNFGLSTLIQMDFKVTEGFVRTMNMSLAGDRYTTLAQYYSINQILLTYGPPSLVRFDVATAGESGIPTKPGYSLFLYYEKLGFLVKYDGFGLRLGNSTRICPAVPTFGTDRATEGWGAVMFYLQSPDNNETLDSLVSSFGTPVHGVDLEEITGWNAESFYEMLIQKYDPVCIEIPNLN